MKEWYLISNTKPNVLSGFEDDYHTDFKESAFIESLDTDLASTIILYNHDLSEFKKVKCIVQDNTANTMLKSIERTLLLPIGTAKAGMYMFFDNRYWLLTGYPGNNKIYEKITATLCQYKLRWQNTSGKIIERWINISSASKYDIGENGNYIMSLTSNNYIVLMPFDEEGLELEQKRVFIDQNKTNPQKIFKFTRNDDSLYFYGEHGGLLSFIADKSEFNKETDNQDLMIADYISPTLLSEIPNKSTISLTIHHKGRNSIIAGGNAKTFTVTAKNEKGNTISIENLKWKLTCLPENEQYVSAEIQNDNSIKIKSLYNESIVGTQILLTASMYDSETSIYIEIGGGI